jgi:xanthine dehydrogenase YagR molybdenum-binding subunit
VDGRLKVTGAAKYSVEFDAPKCAYGWTVESNIAKGKITAIDTKAAQAVPGVLAVLTHVNMPKFKEAPKKEERGTSNGIRNEERFPLSDDGVHYAGQYVALVVAETIEQARHAASLVKVSYTPEEPLLTMEAATKKAEQPKKNNDTPVQIKKGDVEAPLKDGNLVRIEQTYITPTETHNPIEMSGTIAHWEDDKKLTLYDATQFVKGVQNIVARSFGLERENVRIICLWAERSAARARSGCMFCSRRWPRKWPVFRSNCTSPAETCSWEPDIGPRRARRFRWRRRATENCRRSST